MAETNEEDVIAGVLPFTVNGVAYKVPELKWKANRVWREHLQATFAGLLGVQVDTPAGQETMEDAQRQLILDYDCTHVLGDLEDATERELDAIYNRLIEVAFPLAQSRTALMVSLVRAVASAQESSTSGPSPTGGSVVPMTSRPRSPTGRSSSSSRRRRSA